MNVGELEELLARLPADMPVMIVAGCGCRHITSVHKRDRRRIDDPDTVAGFHPVRSDDGRYPQHLTLSADGRAPLWMQAWADDVPLEVTGRWPTRRAARAVDAPPRAQHAH